MSGSFPISKDLWKISCRTGAKSLCKVCRTMGLNLSGPAFKPTSSLLMPLAVMLISGILRWGLGWNGGLAPESCKSCSDSGVGLDSEKRIFSEKMRKDAKRA